MMVWSKRGNINTSVLVWVIWPVKIVAKMTYKVSGGTLNLCSLTHITTYKEQSDYILGQFLTESNIGKICFSVSYIRLKVIVTHNDLLDKYAVYDIKYWLQQIQQLLISTSHA